MRNRRKRFQMINNKIFFLIIEMPKYIAYVTPEKNSLIIDAHSLLQLSGDVTSVKMTIDVVDGNDYEKLEKSCDIYINGVKTDAGGNMMSYASPFVFDIRIDPSSTLFEECELKLSFEVNPSSGKDYSDFIQLYISDSDIQDIGDYTFESKRLLGNMQSFMLVRTNPKLTGNVKLVVDSAGRLYLDTFKVSSVLNERVYRKYPVSSDGNYPHDVMTVFSRLPKSELFKTPDESLNPHKYYSDYEEQYFTDYEYGAETNIDNLYPENMKILAPLHIGKTIPDFFCVFRYDKLFNDETYRSSDIDDKNKFDELLRDSTVVKIFDLRIYTAAGQYLNNYAHSISEFLHGSCYMQFIEQDNTEDSGNYRQGNNSWRGIDVARGIITNKIESSYFAANILSKDSGVQEKFDAFMLNGYERNNVLYPYILNLEFMFDDDTNVEKFSMHRYFGLYLTANEFVQYESVITEQTGGRSVVRKVDVDDNPVNDDRVLANVFKEDFADRIIFAMTNNDAARVTSKDDVKNFINRYVLDNPDRNIANIRAVPFDAGAEHLSFMSLYIAQPMCYGEHLRFVSMDVRPDGRNVCLEIVASNDSRLLNADNYISPYISTNNLKDYIHTDDGETEDRSAEIYRMSFYTQSLMDATVAASVGEQLERI